MASISRRSFSNLFAASRGCYSLRLCYRFSASNTQWSTEQASTSKMPLQLKQIQLVPPALHRHLFGDGQTVPPTQSATTTTVPSTARNEELEIKKLELPELECPGDLLQHFYQIANAQFAPYRRHLEVAAKIEKLPLPPAQWTYHTGWTRYDPINGTPKQIDYPDESVIFFDVEVCMNDGLIPTLATAMSPNAWYSWCSDRLVNGTTIPKLYGLDQLIPLEPLDGSSEPRIVIGHNVAYDRSRVREQYYKMPTATRFWDTMSMAIAIHGMADHQVPLYEKKDTEIDESGPNGWIDYWRRQVCKNSLSALHEKLCGDSKRSVNKSMQTFFVKEPIEEIRKCFQELMTYCANDVIACFEIYKILYDEFVVRFPHPASWQGMLEIGNVYLPVTKNWRDFYIENEQRADNENRTATIGVARVASELSDTLRQNDRYKNDPWMWSVDWANKNTGVPSWFETLMRTKQLINVPISELSQSDVKLKSRVIPRLFGLCWGPFPLHYKADKGWGYLVPAGGISNMNSKNVPEYAHVILRRGDKVCIPVRAIFEVIEQNIAEAIGEAVLSKPHSSIGIFDFHKLPHPNGEDENVGDPLAKFFRTEIEEGVLHPMRYKDEFHELLRARNTTRFWGNYRARLQEQIAIWYDKDGNEGAIAPPVIPAGTVTRRAVHKLWLTAINPKNDLMIGTDLKSMIESPKGWYFVGADVDSQEQWIAALLGDCGTGKGVAGATPFSNMLLAGSKSDQSDLHSVVAKQVGISRDKAKVLNYARLYGAGVTHAVEFLKQSGMSTSKAQAISEKLFATTKGKRYNFLKLSPNYNNHFCWFLENICCDELKSYALLVNGFYFLPEYRCQQGKLTTEFEDWLCTEVQNGITKLGHKVQFDKDWLVEQLYENDTELYQLYTGGFESDTFNYLELKLSERTPRTPFLDCQLGNALTPLPSSVIDHQYFLKKYRRSIINWVVQSSAVDFLHLTLVCMKWLCVKYDIPARFSLSIHDEIRYLVPAEDRYRCSLALALSNMYVRSMFSLKLGIKQLPMSIAFFSAVDIDRVLRKEVTTVCRKPDGREIAPGEVLDIHAILAKTDGTLRRTNQRKSIDVS